MRKKAFLYIIVCVLVIIAIDLFISFLGNVVFELTGYNIDNKTKTLSQQVQKLLPFCDSVSNPF